MSSFIRHVPSTLSTLLLCCPLLVADDSKLMQVTPAMLTAPKTYPAEGFEAKGMKAIFYEGMLYKGQPTRVFAWLGLPEREPGTKVPGIVLVHGGGGTAFQDWVRLWTKRGYAAIAMDTCGTVPRGKYSHWERHDAGGPPGNNVATADEPMTDQWNYHAVADVILAHSLLRSLPEVDPNRIGLTGISWGGYLTCIVSGLDNRFKFAVPVYGCGFLADDYLMKPALEKAGDRGKHWLAMWDPAHYLPNATMPKLWVTGTNDNAFSLYAVQESYRAAGGRSTLCIRLRMPHGHNGPGENPEEIHVFANSILNGGKPLAKITAQLHHNQSVGISFQSEAPIDRAELLYTKGTGSWKERLWETAPASVDNVKHAVTAVLPKGTTVYFVNLIDNRNLVVSSEHVEVEEDEDP